MEADETFIGGKSRNMQKAERPRVAGFDVADFCIPCWAAVSNIENECLREELRRMYPVDAKLNLDNAGSVRR